MKRIRYRMMTEVNHGTEEEPNIVHTLRACEIRCNDSGLAANLAIARAEAVGGEVTVEDTAEELTPPSQVDQIEAQAIYTAMMTDTLLEV